MQQYGGVSRYFAHLASELGTDGDLSVRIVAPLHVNAYAAQLGRSLVWGQRVAARSPMMRLAGIVDRTLRRPLAAMFAPDIVHESYYAARRSAPRKARIVLTVYDMIHEKFAAEFPAGDRTADRKRAAIARADHICCISESTRRDLVALHPAAATKASVTLLGFDPPAAAVPSTSGRGRPYLLFVGQRRGYKNFAGLLDAYAMSAALRSDFDLVAVGGGAFKPDEQRAIDRHRLGRHVRQHAAGDAALQRWYREAAVFVYPSLYEGFGIPPLEAMAAGTPVVALDVSSVPEVCGDAAAYAAAGDPDSLRIAIERVALDPAVAARLIAAGRRRLPHFSWRKCAAETAAVYRSLA